MPARKTDAAIVHKRKRLVEKLRFEHHLSLDEVVERLKAKHGIATTRSTVARDADAIRRSFAAYSSEFSALAETAFEVKRLDTVVNRAMRDSARAADDPAKARLYRVAIAAINSKVALLQSCGLLPKDLGTLRVRPEVPAERLPSGIELQEEFQRLWNSAEVTDADITSEAELAWRHGDFAAADAAARNANH